MTTNVVKPRDFKIDDASSYDAHIADFERFTTVLTAPLARRLVSMAVIAPGQRVLDIGTGTGVVALEAARLAGAAGKVVGVDLSPKMLAAAETQSRAAGLVERVEFKAMDAEALTFEDASFDAVVSLFALLHFPNPAMALREMFRVLKPGGTLVVAVGSAPPWLSLRGLAHAFSLVPDLLARLSGRQLVAPRFINQLVETHLPAHDEAEESPLAQEGRDRSRNVPRLIREAGFANLQQHWEGHETNLKTAEDFWNIQRTFSSIARKRLNGATPEQVAAIREEFDKTCGQILSRGGRLTYPFAALFVVARRPLN